MIINTGTFRYFWEVYENNEYSFLFDRLRVLDLGCSDGEFSLWILPRAERVWAVDINEDCINNLKKTVKDNEIKNIDVIKDCVTDLAEFMSGHAIKNIDVLKIDIEGDEYEVFDQEDFPFKEINTIIGEYHKESPEKRLIELGYRYFELSNKHFICRK